MLQYPVVVRKRDFGAIWYQKYFQVISFKTFLKPPPTLPNKIDYELARNNS